jgi:hypothetical protein
MGGRLRIVLRLITEGRIARIEAILERLRGTAGTQFANLNRVAIVARFGACIVGQVGLGQSGSPGAERYLAPN